MTNISKSTHILCVCQHGNVRSVGTRKRLTSVRKFTDVIAIGAMNTSPETLKMLCDWADIILVAEPHLAEPLFCKEKINTDFYIGRDTFGEARNKDLQLIVGEQLDKVGLRR